MSIGFMLCVVHCTVFELACLHVGSYGCFSLECQVFFESGGQTCHVFSNHKQTHGEFQYLPWMTHSETTLASASWHNWVGGTLKLHQCRITDSSFQSILECLQK